jgi:hypothetical protein
MSKNLSVSILEGILGPHSQPMAKLKYLQSTGAEVVLGLFTLSIKISDKSFCSKAQAALSTYASQDEAVKLLIKKSVEGVIEDALKASVDPTWEVLPFVVDNPVIAPAPKVTVTTPVAPTVKNTPKPVEEVVKLRDARAISQKVFGTSSGAVYRVVAVGKVNLAIREQPSTLSIRAEFQGDKDADIVKKLTALGFNEHITYLSMHISLTEGTPAMRVVGSVLLGLGVEFGRLATTKEQIYED